MSGDPEMRAMLIEAWDENPTLRPAVVPRPRAASGGLLLRIEHSAINPADAKICRGLLQGMVDHQLPLIPGFDAAGTVVAVGDGVTAFAANDRVVTYSDHGLARDGTYAEYCTVQADRVVALPDTVPLRLAAAMPTAGVTAYEALFDVGGLKPGQTVLIHGGAGGVGSFAIPMAVRAGAHVIATCRAENGDYVRRLGAHRTVDLRGVDDPGELAATVDILVDAVGAESLPVAPRLMRRGGVIAAIMTLDADVPYDRQALDRAGACAVPAVMNYARAREQLAAMVAMAAEGIFDAIEIAVEPLERAGAVFAGGGVSRRGKTVLSVG